MRILQWPDDQDEVLNLLQSEANIRTASWKQCSDEVLAAIDSQLEPHGLEVIQYERGSDQYIWRIEARTNPSRVRTAIEKRRTP